MAISYVNAAVNHFTAVGTSITCNVPAGVVDGDLLIWTIGGSSPTIAFPATPTGWSVWSNTQTSGTNTGCVFYYRIASSEPASYTQSGLTSGKYATSMTAYHGVDQTNPKDVTVVATTSATTFASPGAITPKTAGAWPVFTEDGNTASGSATAAWASTNATALVAIDQSTVAANPNPALVSGYYSGWTSGAFTFNLTSTAGTFTAGFVVVGVLRPARQTPLIRSRAVYRASTF